MEAINLNSELIVIEIFGEDAGSYLQGQLTNDINELKEKSFQLSAHLNNKGRIIASFFIINREAGGFYLLTSKTLTDKIISRLKMFILRSKVQCQLSSKDIYLITSQPTTIESMNISEGYFLTVGSLPENSQENSTLWHKLLVDNGLPMIYANSSEKIIPQQVNYELIGGVNFKKGCYTGQEIVARTHYLGKVKRRMQRFTSINEPIIGQTVVSPKLDNQEVGFIIDYYKAENKYHGLVSIQTDCSDNAYLENNTDTAITCNPILTENE